MAAQFKITDGTTSVDLLGTNVPIRYDGLPDLGMDVDISFTKSGLGGGGVSGFSFPPVVRTYKLMVKGSSHDDAATQVQALFRLLRKAALYHSDPRYLTPVYIVQQTTNETSPRYAMVYGFQGFNVSSPFEIPFRNQNVLTEIGIPIIQDAFWQPTVPGALPAAKMEWYPVWEKEIHTSADFESTTTEGSTTITDEDEWVVFTADSGTSRCFGRDNDIKRGKTIIVRIRLDLSELIMADGDSFILLNIADDASVGGSAWTANSYLRRNGDEYQIDIRQINDSGSDSSASFATIDKSSIHDLLYVIKLATGAGNDDGAAYLYDNGQLLTSVTGVDSDQKEIEEIRLGFYFGVDVGTQGPLKMSRIAYTIGYDCLPTRVYVTNHEVDNNIPNNIYWRDESASSSHQIAPGDTLFPDPIGTTDNLQIQTPYPSFCIVIPKLSTAGSLDTSDLRFAYYTGSGWNDAILGTDYACYPGPTLKDCFEQTDEDIIIYFNGSASAGTSGGYYYHKFYEAHASPSWSVVPASNNTRHIEIVDTAHVDIPSWVLKGDAPTKLLLRLYAPAGAGGTVGDYGHISRIIIGAKSRNLHRFRHMLNIGNGGLFAGWTVSYGTDTSSATAHDSPAAVRADCTFASDESTVMRARLVGTDMLRYYRGAYKAYLIGEQIGGDPGDVSVKLRIGLQGTSNYSPKWDTDEQTFATTDERIALDLGTINIPFSPESAADDPDMDLIFEIHAGCGAGLGGTVDLKLWRLVLIPIDEWHIELDDPVTNSDYGTSALRGDKVLEIDGGILKDRTITRYNTGDALVPLETWSRRGAPPGYAPAVCTQSWSGHRSLRCAAVRRTHRRWLFVIEEIVIRNNPLSSAGTYHKSLSRGQFENYRHTKRAVGGHYRASFDVVLSLNEMYTFFSENLFREVQVFNHRGIGVWEGFIFGMTLSLGGFTMSVSLQSMANRMWARYYNGTSTVRSTTVEDTDSQNRYWIREQVLTIALYTRLGQVSDPSIPAIEWRGEAKHPVKLSVECRGYWDLLWWRVYNQTTLSGNADADVIIGNILDDVAPWVLEREIADNNTQIEQEIDADRWAGDFINSIAALGDGGYDRWIAGVTWGRKFYYREAAQKEIPT